ncbi:MAG: excinuclease ABC subunit C [Sulfurimonas sp.]|jgi:excinuclease ABC subunit C|uniref:excinuclease ABC subunit UvrC n=1 Tax=Sulfurimonas sp. TaxID=2022749 RepID=UPI0039E66D57
MTLREKIIQLPHTPGVYQYFDKYENLLYVGKAKDLSKRVKSYFSFTPELHPKSTLSTRIIRMLEQTTSLHYIVVKSEHDALILENSLIKQLNPKYNILLRDDKTYPYIYIDNSLDFPRYDITRKIIKSADITYFGPYSVGARDILDSVYELCKLVQKKGCLKSKKLCLYHQIDKCLGPCELPITKERYKQELDLGLELIQNKKLLIKKLEEKMLFYAEDMRFEEAGELRDRIEKISRSEIKSDIDFASGENYDIFAVSNSQSRAVVIRIFMRNGKIISSSHDFIQLNEGYDENEIYLRVLLDFYTKEKPPIIAPILVANDFDGLEIIQKHLSSIFERKAHINRPLRGDKKHLIDLALLNANELLKKDISKDSNQVLEGIKDLLHLQRLPLRVEVFDNSHMSGVATVGAMIVYDKSKFDKKSYRTYHLEAKDEYAQMRETLTRRVKSFEKNSPPDLWIIDGGTTLLKLAREILDSSAVFIDAIAISKEKIDAKSHRAKGKALDILHTSDESFKLPASDKRLQWAQNLRDEAHRSAITFHKKTKLKLDKESKLLNVYGISPAKVKKLLNHFGTFESLKSLSLEDISAVLNTSDAKLIKNIYK